MMPFALSPSLGPLSNTVKVLGSGAGPVTLNALEESKWSILSTTLITSVPVAGNALMAAAVVGTVAVDVGATARSVSHAVSRVAATSETAAALIARRSKAIENIGRILV